MAKRLRFNYTFTPSTKTIVLDGYVSPKRLLLITNLKTNTLIYAFADQNLTATSVSYDTASNRTTVVLSYDTTSMLSTDPLQIFTEDDNVSFAPEEGLYDPVNKLRVSQPQALIDTDFEYGTQPTKWENLALVNSRPFAYNNLVGVGTINFMTMPQGSKTVTVGLTTVLFGSGAVVTPGIGSAITIQDSVLPFANGNFIVDTIGSGVLASTTFTYQAKSVNTTGITNLLDPARTGIFSGTQYTNAAIGGVPSFIVSQNGGGGVASTQIGLAVTVTTTVPHGLSLGNAIAVVGASHTTINGVFNVTSILDQTRFVYFTNSAPGFGTVTGGQVFARPQSLFLHRPFDGGVLFSTNPTSNYEQAIRQTRRYFRYQSGKGFQISTGTVVKPNLQIDSLTASGTGAGSTIFVVTKDAHNILASVPGTQVSIFGANESGFNGTFNVERVTGYNAFNVTSTTGIGTTSASGNYNLSVTGWYGAKNRMGAFDSQNGLFFEFDGQNLFACRRSSTYQIAGRVSVTNGSNTVTQTNAQYPTIFSKQLSIGDFIVLRGQSYRVAHISNDSSLVINPSYRGVTATNIICSKTIDTKVRQSDFNIDKCDGTGPSGYNVDLSKMQMWYIDYSWYGAGFVRYGFRSLNGNVNYVHKSPNNNLNTEAYMRSGNLPARYESISEPFITSLTSNLSNTETGAVGVASTSGFPSTGTILIKNGDAYEYINYTGIGTTALTGLTRAQAGIVTSLTLSGISTGQNVATASTSNLQIGMRVVGSSGSAFPDATYITQLGVGTITFSAACNLQNPTVVVPPMGVGIGTTFAYSAVNPTLIETAYPTFGPSISHWGTSVIMDGRFDDDKSLIFTYGQTTGTVVPVSVGSSERALFSIRVAPSVDNGVTGTFGSRELVNRMQLTLKALDLTTSTANANLLVRAYLNAVPTTATTWTNAVGNRLGAVNSSFAQIADYGGGAATVTNGEVIAGFFVGSGANSIPLTELRDLGNSILGGGGTTSNIQIYPDGPDTLTITVTNLGAAQATVFGRLSWTEAQA